VAAIYVNEEKHREKRAIVAVKLRRRESDGTVRKVQNVS
jgi:hypothetical protein